MRIIVLFLVSLTLGCTISEDKSLEESDIVRLSKAIENDPNNIELLFERVVPGGIVIFDDYTTVQGATLSVDQFLKKNKLDNSIKFSNSNNIITNTNHKNLYEKLKHLDYFKYYNNPQLVKDYEYAKFSKLLKLSQLNIYQDFNII